MQLPMYVVYDRSAQELEDMVDAFIRGRNIPTDVMELILYKVLSHVQQRKAYDVANAYIANEQSKEEPPKEEGESDEQGV